MFDSTASEISHQRVSGSSRVAMVNSRVAELSQVGSAKVMLPRVHSAVPEVVFLNTAGGLTGGDVLSYELSTTSGDTIGTTQTAERAYSSTSGCAEVSVSLSVGEDSRLDWLPQELIVFDGAALSRHTRVDLAPNSKFLFVEVLGLGRLAMGETVRRCHIQDKREIWRAGRLEYLEPLEISDALLQSDAKSGLGEARAIASLGFFAPEAGRYMDAVQALPQTDVVAGVSAWNNRLILRATAPDLWPLRKYIAKVLGVMRDGAPLPRVWQI